jgi:hypothetical protein
MALRRRQLVNSYVLFRCLRLAVVPAYALPKVVRQVQLRPCGWSVSRSIESVFSRSFTIAHSPRPFSALDGGTQIMVFILSFAVQGAAGDSHNFPQWWGNNGNGNYDYCATTS